MTPILFAPYQDYANVSNVKRIVSWWDMLQVDTVNFLSSLTLISSALGEYQILLSMATQTANYRATQPLETRALVLKAIASLQDECSKHGLVMGAKFAHTASGDCLKALAGDSWCHPRNLRIVTGALEQLIKVTVTEADARQFYLLDRTVSEQHDDADTLFGTEVIDAFPSAAFDISEAGKCLSFGLWTASAMHVMKVLEIGLCGLSHHMKIVHSENWNKSLNEIEAALRSISKKTDGPKEEQWAAEAGTHLRFIKNAFRNELAHAGSKCDEREAREIFGNARSFMAHIAEMTEQHR